MAKRSRDKMITFWVTEDELAKINANMEKLGTSNLSAYLRKMAITGLIVQLDIPELKQIVSLMRRTSANINQMAKHINQGDTVAVQQIDGLHEQQEGTVKYYAQIRLQIWQNSVCTGQGNLPLIIQ